MVGNIRKNNVILKLGDLVYILNDMSLFNLLKR